MELERFKITTKELPQFVEACEKSTVNFLKYESGHAYIECRYLSALFYLGQQFQLEKRLDELNPKKRLMDCTKIDNVEIQGIDPKDHPEYCDAFISSADYYGVEMTEEQLDEINDNSDFVHAQVEKHLY